MWFNSLFKQAVPFYFKNKKNIGYYQNQQKQQSRTVVATLGEFVTDRLCIR